MYLANFQYKPTNVYSWYTILNDTMTHVSLKHDTRRTYFHHKLKLGIPSTNTS